MPAAGDGRVARRSVEPRQSQVRRIRGATPTWWIGSIQVGTHARSSASCVRRVVATCRRSAAACLIPTNRSLLGHDRDAAAGASSTSPARQEARLLHQPRDPVEAWKPWINADPRVGVVRCLNAVLSFYVAEKGVSATMQVRIERVYGRSCITVFDRIEDGRMICG